MTPREFFRSGQWAINDGPVNITTDYDEFMAVLESSDYLVFHNGISFDLSVLYGVDSMRPLELAIERKVIDTFVLASLVNPAPGANRLANSSSPDTAATTRASAAA